MGVKVSDFLESEMSVPQGPCFGTVEHALLNRVHGFVNPGALDPHSDHSEESDSDDVDQPKLLIHEDEHLDQQLNDQQQVIKVEMKNNKVTAMEGRSIKPKKVAYGAKGLQKKISKEKSDLEKKIEKQKIIDKYQRLIPGFDEKGQNVFQYQCIACSTILANANLLMRHVLDKHEGVRKYECDQCTKCFKRKEHRERHLRTHTGEKPFKCEECGQKFTQKEHMKGHIKNTHEKKRAPPVPKKLKTIAPKIKSVKRPREILPLGAAGLDGITNQIILNKGIQNQLSYGDGSMSNSTNFNLMDVSALMTKKANLSMLAAAASQLPVRSVNGSEDGSQHSISTEEGSNSPPSLTSPSSIPQYTRPTSSASDYINTDHLAQVAQAFREMSSPLYPTFSAASTNTVFSNFIAASTASHLSPASLNTSTFSSPSFAGRGRGRGRGRGGGRGRKSRVVIDKNTDTALSSLPANSFVEAPLTSNSRNYAELAALLTAANNASTLVNGNAATDAEEEENRINENGVPTMTNTFSPVTRSGISSPQKLVNEVTVKIPSES